MEGRSETLTPNKQKRSSRLSSKNQVGRHKSFGDEDEDGDEECDMEAWETLSKSFRDVQSVLDQNRALIQQVNENHQSKLHGNMVKNVGLINEINGNISKVMGMYSDLNVNFTNIVHQRSASDGTNKGMIGCRTLSANDLIVG